MIGVTLSKRRSLFWPNFWISRFYACADTHDYLTQRDNASKHGGTIFSSWTGTDRLHSRWNPPWKSISWSRPLKASSLLAINPETVSWSTGLTRPVRETYGYSFDVHCRKNGLCLRFTSSLNRFINSNLLATYAYTYFKYVFFDFSFDFPSTLKRAIKAVQISWAFCEICLSVFCELFHSMISALP
jgi:hypothetical protein